MHSGLKVHVHVVSFEEPAEMDTRRAVPVFHRRAQLLQLLDVLQPRRVKEMTPGGQWEDSCAPQVSANVQCDAFGEQTLANPHGLLKASS